MQRCRSLLIPSYHHLAAELHTSPDTDLSISVPFVKSCVTTYADPSTMAERGGWHRNGVSCSKKKALFVFYLRENKMNLTPSLKLAIWPVHRERELRNLLYLSPRRRWHTFTPALIARAISCVGVPTHPRLWITGKFYQTKPGLALPSCSIGNSQPLGPHLNLRLLKSLSDSLSLTSNFFSLCTCT